MGPPPSHTKHRLLSLAPPHLACQVRVLGESYTPEDEEDSCVAEVSAVWVYQARYRVPVSKAVAGNLVLLEGVDKVRGEGEAAGGEGGAGWAVGWHFYKTEEGQPGKSV